MPVTLPDFSQERRTTPRPSLGIVSYRGGVSAEAEQEVARSLQVSGDQLNRLGIQAIDAQGQIEYADARTSWLQAKIKADRAFDNDPDYKTYGARYDKLTAEARDQAVNGISSASARARFEADVDGDIAAGKADIDKLAFSKESDFERDKLNSLIATNQSAMLTTTDQNTINGLLAATDAAIQGAAAKGYVSAVEAGTLSRGFVEKSSEARLAMLPPDQRLAVIMSRASNAPQQPAIVEQSLMPATVSAPIAKAAQAAGVDAATLQRIAELESSGNPGAVNPLNPDVVGLFQLSSATAAQYGVADRTDPVESARGAAELMKDNERALRTALGRDPTPAELYLAHQQGAAGAAALIKHPNQTAIEALTPVYGDAAKAEAAILQNGGTSGLSAAAFVSKWSSKFSGIAPTVAQGISVPPDGGWMYDKKTGTYADFIPPDRLEVARQDTLRDMDKQESDVRRRAEVEVAAGWDDARQNALMTGRVDQSFVAKTAAAYSDQPEVAAQKVAELNSFAQMGQDGAVIDDGTLTENQAYIASLVPTAGPGAALQQVRYDNAVKLYEAKLNALKDDPATWVHDNSDEVKGAWQQAAAALDDPNVRWAEKQAYAKLAVAATENEERRQGLGPGEMKILPKSIAEKGVAAIRSAPPAEVGQRVDEFYDMYGPRGVQELVQNGAPADIFALASANGPQDGPWRSALVNAMQMKPEDLGGAVKKRGILPTDIQSAYDSSAYNDLINTLPPSAVPMYSKAIDDVMQFQMAAGKDATAALDFALAPFVNGFTFNGTYRVPNRFDAGKVQTGLDGVIAHLEQFNIQPEDSRSGNPAVVSQQEFSGDVGAAVEKFPALAKVAGNVVVEDKQSPGDGRQLESYPPWEGENPHPGKFTTQVFNGATGDARTNLVAGDMLHYLGAVDPETGKAVDPVWRSMKEKFIKSLRPEQVQRDKAIFEQQKNMMAPGVTFDQWMDVSRADAYFRGYLTPDGVNEWRYPPEQIEILKQMKQYLSQDSAGSYRVSEQIAALRRGQYRWITTESGDAVTLTYDDGSMLGQPVMTANGPLVVRFEDAQTQRFGVAPAEWGQRRPLPGQAP